MLIKKTNKKKIYIYIYIKKKNIIKSENLNTVYITNQVYFLINKRKYKKYKHKIIKQANKRANKKRYM